MQGTYFYPKKMDAVLAAHFRESVRVLSQVAAVRRRVHKMDIEVKDLDEAANVEEVCEAFNAQIEEVKGVFTVSIKYKKKRMLPLSLLL